jgi:hypothetical protein
MTLSEWIRQLKDVEGAKFEGKNILNRGEAVAFYAARDLCGELQNVDFYVMAQVSFGEMFKTVNMEAYLAINWMRCDVVVIDRFGMAAAVIEVQGSGHFGDTVEDGFRTCIKDEIKRCVCRSAGVPMLEIAGGKGNVIRDLVRRRLSECLMLKAVA